MSRILSLSLFFLVIGIAHADLALFDFSKGFDPKSLSATDAQVSAVSEGLRIATGHAQPWPGVTLPAPNKTWDLSPYARLAIDLKNTGTSSVTLYWRVDNPGGDGVNNCVTVSIALDAGKSGTLRVDLPHNPWAAQNVRLFGMRGYPDGANGTLDPANITQFIIFVARPTEDHVFEIRQIRAEGAYTPPDTSASFFPFIDTFGQYIHREWPGKVHSLDELKQHRVDEEADLAAKPGPSDWDQYGGWKNGPQLATTGWFLVEKYKGKWWLVDPEGRLFFSHGIDCVGALNFTPIDERAKWFQDFPGDEPDLSGFASNCYALHGHYAGKTVKCYMFDAANMRRKYGDDWWAKSAELIARRLRSWGINTIGNWSDRRVYTLRKTPYVATIHYGCKMIEGSAGYWGKFPDVFDPDFAAAVRERMAQEVGKSAGDPWCIGYFVDNEMSWGDEGSLANAALMSPPDQAAKKAFIEDLRDKYVTIERLNAAWGSSHESWEALTESRKAPDADKAKADLLAFYTRAAEQYFRVVRDAVKEVAPNQLYLGCRFAWVNPRAVAAAVKYCDVVSYNLYRRSVADFKMPVEADMPLIIGEFHFGALDRGMFHTGLVPVASQAERAEAYTTYVTGVLKHPQFVGCHWFQYQDEPTTGRVLDEENYQIGFVDVTDSPYPETIAAVREIGRTLYTIRSSNE